MYCKNDDPHQYHCVQNKQTTVLSETTEESRRPTTPITPCNASYASNAPVLEYTSPFWHYSITRAQSYQLESIQKRAVHITFSDTRGMSYPNVLFVANLHSQTDEIDFHDPFLKIFSNRILVSITFFHLPVTLPSFPDYVLPHLSLAQSHEPKSLNHF